MNILYIGDIYGQPGIDTVERVLPELKKDKKIDLVIAQAENVSDGRSMTADDMGKLRQLGVDCFTGGNWTLFRDDIIPYLDDPNEPVLRPANYPAGTPGQRWKYVLTDKGKVLVVSLLGSIVGRDADKLMDNPLKVIDEILDKNKQVDRVATIVNFHGDYSSEKVIIGYYLDGRVTAAIGDHWHTPTADPMVLPKGTAHITDVGMCGTVHSSLGVDFDSVIPRWRDGKQTKNVMSKDGPFQFNAVLIEADTKTGLAKNMQLIRKILH